MKNLATAFALVGLCALIVLVQDTAPWRAETGPVTGVAAHAAALPSPGYARCGEVLAGCGRLPSPARPLQ